MLRMPSKICRWGILGTASIARKNWQAIRNAGVGCADGPCATLTAVASRDRERSRRFIEACQASVPFAPPPDAVGSYEELLERRDIDAVYLPLPTAIRKDWVIRAARAGKHVLCEKPCGVDSASVRAMLDACRESKVQFMDGVMFMHSQRLGLLRRTLDDQQSVGALRRIVSQFSFQGSEDFLANNIRVHKDTEPLGCLGDLGWYNIRLSLWIMNEQLPERVSGRLLASGGSGGLAVPLEFSGELFFPDGVTSSFYCSFRTNNQEWAHISGSEGYVYMPDFVVPFNGPEAAFETNAPFLRIIGCDFNMESHPQRLAVHEYSSGRPGSQESRMIETFSRIVLSGRLEPRWSEQALNTQRVVDACLQSARADGKIVSVT
jgi:predicted dehydrogenase